MSSPVKTISVTGVPSFSAGDVSAVVSPAGSAVSVTGLCAAVSSVPLSGAALPQPARSAAPKARHSSNDIAFFMCFLLRN